MFHFIHQSQTGQLTISIILFMKDSTRTPGTFFKKISNFCSRFKSSTTYSVMPVSVINVCRRIVCRRIVCRRIVCRRIVWINLFETEYIYMTSYSHVSIINKPLSETKTLSCESFRITSTT